MAARDASGGLARVPLALAVFATVCIAAFTAVWTARGQSLPYYFNGDVDAVVVQDLLAMQGGHAPDFITAPGFGMYLTLAFVQRVQHYFGAISVLSTSGLEGALSPLAAVAENTRTIRSAGPFAAAISVLALWCGLLLLYRPRARHAALVLLALCVQGCWLYQSALVRTELYAALFWCLAFLLLACALRARSPLHFLLCCFLSGGLGCLSVFSKIQAAGPVLALPCFVLLAAGPGAAAAGPPPEAFGGPLRRRLAWGAIAASGAAAAILAAAYATPAPPGTSFEVCFDLFARGAVTPLSMRRGVLAVLGTGLWGVGGLLAVRHGIGATRWSGPVFSGAAAALLGAWGALGLHFAPYAAWAAGYEHLLCDLRTVFLSETYAMNLYYVSSANEHPLWLSVLDMMAFNLLSGNFPLRLAGPLAAAFLLAAHRARPAAPPGRAWRVPAACAGVFGLVLLTTRGSVRDGIWIDTVLGALLMALLLEAANRGGRTSRIAVSLVLAGVAAAGTSRLPAVWAAIDANANTTDMLYRNEYWGMGIFPGNGGEYDRVMRGTYGLDLSHVTPMVPMPRPPAAPAAATALDMAPAVRMANLGAQVRERVRSVFRNQHLDFTHIGSLASGYPVWASDREWRFAELPPDLSGGVAIDLAGAPMSDRYYYFPGLREGGRPIPLSPAPMAEPPPEARLAVLPRADMRAVLYCEEPGDFARLPAEKVRAWAPRVQVANGDRTVEFTGMEIVSYAELPAGAFEGRYFGVLVDSPAPWRAPEPPPGH